MNIYTTEISPETSDTKGYTVVRCPHDFADGHKCKRQLFRLRCNDNTTIEIKCPKCKTVLRINVIGTKPNSAVEQR